LYKGINAKKSKVCKRRTLSDKPHPHLPLSTLPVSAVTSSCRSPTVQHTALFLACTISFTCTRICLRLHASYAGSVKIVFPRFDAVLQHISTAQLLTPSRHPPSPAHHADLLLLSLASAIASLQSQEGVLMLTATHIIFVEPKTNAETMVRHICDHLSSPRPVAPCPPWSPLTSPTCLASFLVSVNTHIFHLSSPSPHQLVCTSLVPCRPGAVHDNLQGVEGVDWSAQGEGVHTSGGSLQRLPDPHLPHPTGHRRDSRRRHSHALCTAQGASLTHVTSPLCVRVTLSHRFHSHTLDHTTFSLSRSFAHA
jgi:hypothetical protein